MREEKCRECGDKIESPGHDICYGCHIDKMVKPQHELAEEYCDTGEGHANAQHRIKLGIDWLDCQTLKIVDFAKAFLSSSEIEQMCERERRIGLKMV